MLPVMSDLFLTDCTTWIWTYMHAQILIVLLKHIEECTVKSWTWCFLLGRTYVFDKHTALCAAYANLQKVHHGECGILCLWQLKASCSSACVQIFPHFEIILPLYHLHIVTLQYPLLPMLWPQTRQLSCGRFIPSQVFLPASLCHDCSVTRQVLIYDSPKCVQVNKCFDLQVISNWHASATSFGWVWQQEGSVACTWSPLHGSFKACHSFLGLKTLWVIEHL